MKSKKSLCLQNEEDPFLVECNFEEVCVTPLQMAFKAKKSERVLPILEITEGQFAVGFVLLLV